MSTNWYEETINTLVMRTPKSRILNRLNEVASRSNDGKLRELAKTIIREIESTSNNTSSQPPAEMRNGVPTAQKAIRYCESIHHRNSEVK